MVAHKLKMDRPRTKQAGLDQAQVVVSATLRKTFNRSQVLVPVDTGYLRASGKTSQGAKGLTYQGKIEYTAEYAAAVHNGRRALTIRPKSSNPRARLRFQVGGRTVYAREVHQPARAGRPYLLTALQQIAPGEGFTVSIG